MCNKRNSVRFNGTTGFRVDPCMRATILALQKYAHLQTLACCCGHGRYPKTIVVKHKNGQIKETFSNVLIPRKKRFYHRDKDGFYFIPETINFKS